MIELIIGFFVIAIFVLAFILLIFYSEYKEAFKNRTFDTSIPYRIVRFTSKSNPNVFFCEVQELRTYSIPLIVPKFHYWFTCGTYSDEITAIRKYNEFMVKYEIPDQDYTIDIIKP